MNRSVVVRGPALLSSSLALAGLLMSSLPAQAEPIARAADIAKGSPLAQYLASGEYADKLITLAQRWDRALEVKCDEPLSIESPLGPLFIERPISMAASATAPTAGIWRQRFTVKRCGKAQVYNAFLSVGAEQKLHVGALLPGKSQLSSLQAREVLNGLTQSIKQAEFLTRGGKACLDFGLLDTEIVTPVSGKAGVPGRMEERWSVRYCNTVRPTPMCFTPSADGALKFRAQTCVDADKTEAEERAQAAAEAASAAAAASSAAPAKPATESATEPVKSR